MTERKFEPFADDDTVVSVDGLTIENGFGEIAMFGDIVFRRGDGSLEKIRSLISHLTGIAAALEVGVEGVVSNASVVEEIENPF